MPATLSDLIGENTLHDPPTVTGSTETFLMATGFLVLCFGAGLLVPRAGVWSRKLESSVVRL